MIYYQYNININYQRPWGHFWVKRDLRIIIVIIL